MKDSVLDAFCHGDFMLYLLMIRYHDTYVSAIVQGPLKSSEIMLSFFVLSLILKIGVNQVLLILCTKSDEVLFVCTRGYTDIGNIVAENSAHHKLAQHQDECQFIMQNIIVTECQ